MWLDRALRDDGRPLPGVMNPPSAGGRVPCLGQARPPVPPVGEVVRRIGALRGRSLVLVYHRVDQDGRPPGQIVPSVSANVFGRQLDALGEVGEIVPLRALLQEARRNARPRFAVTFDDDFVTHVDHALPILRDRGAPATFFLSGRSLRRSRLVLVRDPRAADRYSRDGRSQPSHRQSRRRGAVARDRMRERPGAAEIHRRGEPRPIAQPRSLRDRGAGRGGHGHRLPHPAATRSSLDSMMARSMRRWRRDGGSWRPSSVIRSSISPIPTAKRTGEPRTGSGTLGMRPRGRASLVRCIPATTPTCWDGGSQVASRWTISWWAPPSD